MLVLLTGVSAILPFVEKWVFKGTPLAPYYFITIIVITLLVLFSPLITRLRAGEFEAELTPPPAAEPTFSAVMEKTLKESEPDISTPKNPAI